MRVAYVVRVVPGEQIAVDDPRDPDVRALLERHRRFALARTPFAGYQPSQDNLFMTLELSAAQATDQERAP